MSNIVEFVKQQEQLFCGALTERNLIRHRLQPNVGIMEIYPRRWHSH